jgi:hypothetical protein
MASGRKLELCERDTDGFRPELKLELWEEMLMVSGRKL